MSSVQSVLLINQLKPELLIMDIQMPQMNAFDVLNNVSFHDFEIIFVQLMMLMQSMRSSIVLWTIYSSR